MRVCVYLSIHLQSENGDKNRHTIFILIACDRMDGLMDERMFVYVCKHTLLSSTSVYMPITLNFVFAFVRVLGVVFPSCVNISQN